MSGGKKKVTDISNRNRHIQVSGVGNTLHFETKNIAGHLGVSMSDFIKTKIADVVHSYPDHYKKPMND